MQGLRPVRSGALRSVRRFTMISGAVLAVVSCQAYGNPGDVLFEFVKPHHARADVFGHAMASYGDDVLISAPFDDQAGFGAGVVYRYNARGEVVQSYFNPTPYSGSAGSESR